MTDRNPIETAGLWLTVLALAATGCGPTVRPMIPVVRCEAVASGKLVHLNVIEDWRKDGLGDHMMGEAITLDAGVSVRNLVLGAVVSSLDCMGFLPAEAGPGIPELRVAVTGIRSSPGMRVQVEPALAPEPGSPESLPGYKPIVPVLGPSVSPGEGFVNAVWIPDEEEWEEEEGEDQGQVAAGVAPVVSTQPQEDPRARLMLSVKIALFDPSGKLALESDISVNVFGPVAPSPDDPDGASGYAAGLSVMVTDALGAMGTEIVRVLGADLKLIASLPTLQDLAASKAGPKKGKDEPKKGKDKPAKPEPGDDTSGGATAKASKTDSETDQLLWSAIAKSSWDKARSYILDGADIDSAVGTKGLGKLHLLALGGDVEAVKALVGGGEKPDLLADGGLTPLHLACRVGDLAMVKQLIKSGADPLATDKAGYTALHHACAAGQVGVASHLLTKHKLDCDLDPTETLTPLMAAARAGQLDVAKLLMERGADMNEASLGGMTALHHAAEANQPAIVEYLISKGANPDVRDAFLKTPLHHAVQGCPENVSCLAVVELLVDKGADKSALDTDGKSALDHAMYQDDAELMEFLAK